MSDKITHNKWEESKKTLKDLFKKYNIDIV